MEDEIKNQSNKSSEEKVNDKGKKKSAFKKYVLNILIVLVVTCITVGVTVGTQKDNIVAAMEGLKWKWMAAAFGCVVGAFIVRSLIYWLFARLYTRKYYFHQAFAVDQIGIFYSAITPGATGGQFMQAYTFKKQGLPISAGASIMVMSSIIYQFVLIIFGIVSLSVQHEILTDISIITISFSSDGTGFALSIVPLIAVGFILNFLVIGILLLMSYSKAFHHFMLGPMITFLHFLHIVKDPDKAAENLRIQVENFKIELKRLLSNIPFTILISILYFIVLTLLFAVPCFVGKALGSMSELNINTFFESVFMSSFHQMVTGLIPIPGSAGVSELFFFQLFDEYFGQVNGTSIAAAAQLFWRTITFTFPLLVSGLISAFYRSSPKDEVERRILNHQTFVNLQRETYLERQSSAETLYETTKLTRTAILNKLLLRDRKDNEEENKNDSESNSFKEVKPKRKPSNKKPKKAKDNSSIDWNEMNIGDDED